jgi:uncharacterized membrane protein YbhN (UPF0104 family)
VSIGLPALIVGYATGYVATILPLPAGGAGGVDAAGVYALTLVGVSLSSALLAMLVLRICSYWLPVLVAVVSARTLARLGRELGEVARATA